jgi:hypothetical protein
MFSKTRARKLLAGVGLVALLGVVPVAAYAADTSDNAPDSVAVCTADEHQTRMQERLADPEFQRLHEERQALMQERLQDPEFAQMFEQHQLQMQERAGMGPRGPWADMTGQSDA